MLHRYHRVAGKERLKGINRKDGSWRRLDQDGEEVQQPDRFLPGPVEVMCYEASSLGNWGLGSVDLFVCPDTEFDGL